MKGIVIKSTGSWFTVKSENSAIIECRIKGKFRIQGIKSTNPVAVGDYVVYELEQDGTGIINELIPRKNFIVRKATKLSKQTHIIAANMDQAALIISIVHPKTPLGFIDRFLATAEAYNIPVVLVFNKIDLCTDKVSENMEYLTAVYQAMDYQCLHVSATEKTNTELFKKILLNKTTLLAGQSGSGKSSLINAVEPALNLKTTTVSARTEKGKHTTTFAEMFDLSFGGRIIDTPGVRSFGVVDFDKNLLSHYFREIFEIGKECKYANCNHINEPNCAVKVAVENGEMAESRYISYQNIYFDKDLEIEY